MAHAARREVFVMEPTHAGHLHHPALARRLHTPWRGRVLGQRQVCPGPVVVICGLRQDPQQTPFADHHHMVKAFPSNRSNHALGIGVLPGQARDEPVRRRTTDYGIRRPTVRITLEVRSRQAMPFSRPLSANGEREGGGGPSGIRTRVPSTYRNASMWDDRMAPEGMDVVTSRRERAALDDTWAGLGYVLRTA